MHHVGGVGWVGINELIDVDILLVFIYDGIKLQLNSQHW